MPKIEFSKYQGTGNDFVLIDARTKIFEYNKDIIKTIANRNLGIGSDGVILLENDNDTSFYMRYFNPDGSQVGMCGNGSRCIGLFARHLGIIQKSATFKTLDGIHDLSIESRLDSNDSAVIKVSLIDVDQINKINEYKYFLNTGVNHVVVFKKDIDLIDIMKDGAEIRYSKEYEEVGGTNANFVEIISDNLIKIRTYERGVENETLACGTATAATAIATAKKLNIKTGQMTVETKGGILQVFFDLENIGAKNIYIQGEVKLVFKGVIEL